MSEWIPVVCEVVPEPLVDQWRNKCVKLEEELGLRRAQIEHLKKQSLNSARREAQSFLESERNLALVSMLRAELLERAEAYDAHVDQDPITLADVLDLQAERDAALAQVEAWKRAFGQVVEARDIIVGERDAALAEVERLRIELAEARAILSDAVGHNDEPHETMADCARLLVLDCDAEHERAVMAEDELAATKARRCETCASLEPRAHPWEFGRCDGASVRPWMRCADWAKKGGE